SRRSGFWQSGTHMSSSPGAWYPARPPSDRIPQVPDGFGKLGWHPPAHKAIAIAATPGAVRPKCRTTSPVYISAWPAGTGGRQRRRRLRGTFAPFLRASDRPIAIACFRLFTVGRRPRPDFSVPLFIRRMALLTLFCAPSLYFRPPELRRLAIASSLMDAA